MSHSETYQKALGLYEQGNTSQAKSLLEKLTEASPPFEDAFEALSVIYYNEKDYDSAIKLLKLWLNEFPKAIMAYTNLSRCYIAQDMILEAEQAQAEARKLSWAAELKGKNASEPERNFSSEIQRYKEVIALDPQDVLGYFSLGKVYAEAGQSRDAVDTFEKAIDVDPSHSSSYLGLGEALLKLGDKAKAVKIFKRGIPIAQNNGDIMPAKRMQALLDSSSG